MSAFDKNFAQKCLSTGWILMIDQKYFLTVTQFWAQTIFYAYGGLTKGGPFDKIAFSVFESI